MATAGYRLAAALAVLIAAGTTAAGWQGGRTTGTAPAVVPLASPSGGASQPARPNTSLELRMPSARAAQDVAATPTLLRPATQPPAKPTLPVLTAAARKACPAGATACVDLKDHLTWLQARGRITYGPVAMEPGTPGTSDATPRGTFHVTWKAGPGYMSNEYHEPMPWAVFFINGVAFHGGSLTKHSHGCVHLAIGKARYYHDHLPVGAEVVVF
jgi:hypothetical protein